MKNTNNNLKNIKREGRVIALQALFSYEFNKQPVESLLTFDWLTNKNVASEAISYATLLIKGTIDYLPMIDSAIKARLKNWDFDRISNIDKSILRFSVYSIFFEQDLPERVIINEAVELTKEFGAKDSYKFVNGVLDAVRRTKE